MSHTGPLGPLETGCECNLSVCSTHEFRKIERGRSVQEGSAGRRKESVCLGMRVAEATPLPIRHPHAVLRSPDEQEAGSGLLQAILGGNCPGGGAAGAEDVEGDAADETRSDVGMEESLLFDRFGFSIEPSPTAAVAPRPGVFKDDPPSRAWQRIRVQLLEEGQLKRSRELKLLVRGGVPESIRGRVWLSLSGADSLRAKYPRNYYQELIAGPTFKERTVATGEIEKDLLRTFPGHRMFREEEGVSALRRILVAYSLHNTEVGYCQSLNVLAALLLLFLDEVSPYPAVQPP